MAFPTTGVLDDFNRANESPLSDSGKWAQGPAEFGATLDFVVTSNRATPEDTSTGNMYRSDQTYGPDSEVFVTIISWIGSLAMKIYARAVNVGAGTTDGYVMHPYPMSSLCSFERLDNAVATVITTPGFTLSAGDSFGLEMIGSTLTAYGKTAGSWSAGPSTTDSTYSAPGYIGLLGQDNTMVFDDFGGGTVAVPPPGTTIQQQPGQGSRW